VIITLAQERLCEARRRAHEIDGGSFVTAENDCDVERLHSESIIACARAMTLATRVVAEMATRACAATHARVSLERPVHNVALAATHTVDLALSNAHYDEITVRASIKGINSAVTRLRVHAGTQFDARDTHLTALDAACVHLLKHTECLLAAVRRDTTPIVATQTAVQIRETRAIDHAVPAATAASAHTAREFEAQQRILRLENELGDARRSLIRVRAERMRAFDVKS
jgi:hypothetical protein